MSSNKDTKVHVVSRQQLNHSVKTELKMSSDIHVGMKNTKEGKHIFMYVMGQLKFQWGRLKIKPKRNFKGTCIKHQGIATDVNTAAQITVGVGTVEKRDQNELNYPCSDEKHQGRHTYVYLCCFAWDSSNSSGEGPKSRSK